MNSAIFTACFILPLIFETFSFAPSNLPLALHSHPDTPTHSLTLNGRLMTSHNCETPSANENIRLKYECLGETSASQSSQVETGSSQFHSDAQGRFSNEIYLGKSDSKKRVCKFTICRENKLCFKLSATILAGEKSLNFDADKLCSAPKRIKTTKRQQSFWKYHDLDWLKRSPRDVPRQRYKRSEMSPSDSDPDKKRLWEGAEDEIGWMKRQRNPGLVPQNVGSRFRPCQHPSRRCGMNKQYSSVSRSDQEDNLKDEGIDKSEAPRNSEDTVTRENLKRHWQESDIAWL